MHTFDQWIFHLLNTGLASPFGDILSGVLTTVRYWYPVYAAGAAYLVYRYRWAGLWIVIGAAMTVACTDSLGHYLLKPLVHRERPCAVQLNGERAVPDVRLPSGSRQDDSFPSNHALNNFAVAAFFAAVFRGKRGGWWMYLVALCIAVARIYQGLHYPSDVAGGAIIGAVVGWGIGRTWRRWTPGAMVVDKRGVERPDNATYS